MLTTPRFNWINYGHAHHPRGLSSLVSIGATPLYKYLVDGWQTSMVERLFFVLPLSAGRLL